MDLDLVDQIVEEDESLGVEVLVLGPDGDLPDLEVLVMEDAHQMKLQQDWETFHIAAYYYLL